MNSKIIMSHIDHTQLKAFTTWDDIYTLCKEALKYNTASVCIPPSYVKKVATHFSNTINICTVIGFPLGYSTTSAKVEEALTAVNDGASEIDMVINIADVKNADFSKVLDEIKAIRAATEGKILKVIIETCYLTMEEKVKMCQLVTEANADYIKTSTGFGTHGATVEDILLFKENIGPTIKIKAAGGIKTLDDLVAFIELGCDRIGTSSAIKLLESKTPDSY